MIPLKELRQTYGLSQEALAARFGLSVEIVRSWEDGRSSPNDKQAASLSRFFGVSPEALVCASTLAPVGIRSPEIQPPAEREREPALA